MTYRAAATAAAFAVSLALAGAAPAAEPAAPRWVLLKAVVVDKGGALRRSP